MKFKFLFRKFGIALVLFAAMISTAAAQKPGDATPRRETLLNGLKVLMWNDPSASKVNIRIRIHGGSAFDPQGKEGAMKMLAESLFPTAAIRDFFRDDLGGSLDVVSNFDYIQINASSNPDQFTSALESLATGISNPVIDKEITAQLKTAQLAKIAELSKNPIYLADNAAAARLFGAFPYGRPQIGTPETVQKIDFADLLDLKQRLLTADNASIAISGNIDGNLVYRAVRRFFGGWLKSDKRIPSTFRQPDPPKSGVQIFDSPVADKSEFRFAIRGTARSDQDYYASAVLASILDNRLKRDERGKAFVRQEAGVLPGWYLFGVSDWNLGGIRRDSGKIAMPVTDDYQKRILDAAVKPEEFDAAKREYISAFARYPSADFWLDIDTYKLDTAKTESDKAQAVTIADTQRVLDRLRKEPVVYILVFGESARAARGDKLMAEQNTSREIEHARAVREMFSGIAGRYDLLNHVLSVNIDKRWRRLVRKQLQEILGRGEASILDVACGTGDLSIELKRNAKARVIGSDFCRPMLAIARPKAAALDLSIPFVEGDALDLPFADSSFDALTIAFGLRNLASFEGGLKELHRVLKPGGKLIVLEFSTPIIPGFRGLFQFYFTRVLPRIGGVVSGSHGAYEYLPDSVSKFPDQKRLADLMRETGFGDVSYVNLTGGIAAIHNGTKV